MSDVVRLTLVSHAMTDAMAAGRFPVDEPLNQIGRRQVKKAGRLDVQQDARLFAGPELRARETAQLLGLHAATEPRLADLQCGGWCGQTLRAVGPADLETWLTDPAGAPHGGESIVDLIRRVAGWLETLAGDTAPVVAVTHPAVIRAAILHSLDAPPKSFWGIDIAPVSRTVLHHRNGRWTLRL
ncbi:histidine phosphatase family protein [Mycobacterium paraense]|uniref:histidine phosphatase family protein n=1 Tax=Mycobacterium paraense TaxID=767916 RepID=UPI000A166215|nr:histidine phosphatase family protein [Mycobacterium paraense]MCV7441388.1 histidine phosphatase family protein [Mycobacterium paraense]ORW41285.1 histidine phosphatase [Mycobacterium paraense]